MTTVTIPDLVQIAASTLGTGDVGLGEAVPSFRGIEALTDGATYHYSIGQTGDYEYGAGVYDATAGTLTRDVFGSSNGGDPLALRAGATVSFVALAADIASGGGGAVGPNLQAIDAQTTAADTLTYWTGDATAGLTTLTAYARTFLAGASAAAARTLLGLGTMATQAVGSFVTTAGGVLTGVTRGEKITLSADGETTTGPYESVWDSRLTIIGTSDSDGIKVSRFSNDRKAVLWLIGKSRAASNSASGPYPPAQAGDDIFNFSVLGTTDTNWAHVGTLKWRVCADSKVAGDPNVAAEVPGAYEIITCTGNYGPAFPFNNRTGLRVDMFQQVFIAGPRSQAPQLVDYPSDDPVTTFSNGGNAVIGIGGPEIGGASIKLLYTGGAFTTVPEPGTVEIHPTTAALYTTPADGVRRILLTAAPISLGAIPTNSGWTATVVMGVDWAQITIVVGNTDITATGAGFAGRINFGTTLAATPIVVGSHWTGAPAPDDARFQYIPGTTRITCGLLSGTMKANQTYVLSVIIRQP